jgi:hypothetical protein
VVAPWSGFWDRNLFLGAAPSLEQVFASPFTRGAVSGVGAITVIAGLVELSGVLAMRQRARAAAPPADGPGGATGLDG